MSQISNLLNLESGVFPIGWGKYNNQYHAYYPFDPPIPLYPPIDLLLVIMRHICPIIGQTKVTKVDMSKFDSKISGRNEAKLHNILWNLISALRGRTDMFRPLLESYY